jgi:hypothetical protein
MESIEALRRCEHPGGFHRTKEELERKGRADGVGVSYLNRKKETTMKVTTIALATAFTLTSTQLRWRKSPERLDTDQSWSPQWARTPLRWVRQM